MAEVHKMGKEQEKIPAEKLNEEDSSIFDETETTEELPDEEETSPDEEDEEYTPFTPVVSKESPKELKERKGEKKEMDGKTLTVKEVFFTRPKTQQPNGEPIKPKETQDGAKEFYPGKLGIRFEEDNLVEYYPSFKYFVNDGKVSNVAKIFRTGDNAIANIFKMAVAKIGKPEDEVSDQEFYNWIVGKKVKIKTAKGKFQGRTWFRNDIESFV
jgi:hypothetical protein